MPVLYKLMKNGNAKSPAYGKWYAKAKHVGTVDINKLSEIMQRNCTVKQSDIKAVLTELVETMCDQLQASMRVKLDGFGTFKLGISSEGVNEAYEFNVRSNIKDVHVLFQPETTVDANKQRHKTFIEKVKIQEAPKNDVDTTKPTTVSDGNNTNEP